MTLEDVFRLVLRRWWLVGLAALVGAGIGYAYESSKPDTFEATGRIVIGPALDDPDSIIESTGALTRGTLPQTLAEVVTGSEVREAAEASLSAPAGVEYEVESVVIPQTSVIEVDVSGPDADTTIALTGAVLEETEAVFERLYPIYDVALLDNPTGPEGPVSPDPLLGGVIGFLVGAMLGVLGAIAIEKRRDGRDEGSPAPLIAGWERRRTDDGARVTATPTTTTEQLAWYEPTWGFDDELADDQLSDELTDQEPASDEHAEADLTEVPADDVERSTGATTDDGVRPTGAADGRAPGELEWHRPTWGGDGVAVDEDRAPESVRPDEAPGFDDPIDEVASVELATDPSLWLDELEDSGNDGHSQRR